MGGLIKNMSRQEPCPVCGKPDYCFWKEFEDEPGMYILYCRRTSEAERTVITGNDGNDYIALRTNSDIVGTKYESVAQREARKKMDVEKGEKKTYTPRKFTVLDSISPLPNEQLDSIYRCMMEFLPLHKHHAKYLLGEGWSMDLIKSNCICSFPAKNVCKLPRSVRKIPSREQLAKKVMDKLGIKSLAGVPGAYKNKSGQWTFTGQSGILFPVYDADGYIYRLRIRLDYLDLPVRMQEDEEGYYYMDADERVTVTMSGPFVKKDGEKIFKRFFSHEGKYRNFSSFKEDEAAYKAGFIENVYHKGCEAKNQLMFVMKPDDDYTVFWITEGEKKGIFSNKVLKQPFICIPGVNDYAKLKMVINGTTALDIMKRRGAKIAIVAFDADRYSNDMVMKCMQALIRLLQEEGFIVIVADWKESDGKGLDDLLSSGYLPSFYSCK